MGFDLFSHQLSIFHVTNLTVFRSKVHIIAIITHLAETKHIMLKNFHMQQILCCCLLIKTDYAFTLDSCQSIISKGEIVSSVIFF